MTDVYYVVDKKGRNPLSLCKPHALYSNRKPVDFETRELPVGFKTPP